MTVRNPSVWLAVGLALLAAPPPSSLAQVPIAAPGSGTDTVAQRTAAPLDDAVPLPDPAQVVAGPDGDTIVKERSGDPFFLSFAGGRYYPPKDERLDPRIGDVLARLGTDGRTRDEVYVFIMMGKRMTDARIGELEALGVRPLGVQPHYSLRAAIPAAVLPVVAALDFVQWVGVPGDGQKVHPELLRRMAHGAAEQEVYVSVVESDLCAASTSTPGPGPAPRTGGPGDAVVEGGSADAARRWMSNGWMQQGLQVRGVAIDQYMPDHHVFRARIRAGQLATLIALDFVQFIEPVVRPELHHDESMPMILADWGRQSFDGGVNNQAIAGIIDSGFDVDHDAFAHVYWVGWNESDPGNAAATVDVCGHGSHVSGTILGEPGAVDAAYRGAAPGLATWQSGRYRFVKWLGDTCLGGSADIANVVAHMRGTFVDQFGVASPRPMVINNSYGTPGAWVGSEYNARVIDDEVFGEDQVYVFAAGNSGPTGGTIGLPGVAKNALTVGSVYDYVKSNLEPPGTIAAGSSRGPCADGRWKPNVVAPGDKIRSVAAGSTDGYALKSGTSMAAPHVTGLIAQLCDGNSAMRYQPERVMSLVQATAITKDDAVLATALDSHLDNYGCGRVNAAKLLSANTSDWTWLNWSVSPTATVTSPVFESGDFVVPSNTERLVVCMTYVEPPSLPGAGAALLHDWDLYIDRPPLSAAGNAGEYITQQSSVDNTEIRIIESPISGVWRWKAYPASVLAPLFDSAKMSITVVLITSDTTPGASSTLVASDTFIRTGEIIDIDATVQVNEYIGSAVALDSTVTPVAPLFTAAMTKLIDGPTTNLLGNPLAGRDLLLGDVLGHSSRKARWSVYWPSEGTMTFSVDTISDNLVPMTSTVDVVVDSTPPTVPAAVTSSTHQPNVWSKVNKLVANWTPAADALAGIAGYSVSFSNGAPSAPPDALGPAGTQFSSTLPNAADGHYVNVKSVDKSGNWSIGFTSNGPYLIDSVQPGTVVNLGSSTHQPNVWSKNPGVTFAWQPAADAHSGLAGYSVATSSGAPVLPDAQSDLGPAAIKHAETLTTSSSGYYFNVRSVDVAGNWDDDAASFGPIRIDTVAPGAPVNLASPTHQVGVSSTNVNVTVDWSAAFDAHSGVEGYDTEWDQSAATVPAGVVDTTATTKSASLSASGQDWWFHVRARDTAGNLGPTAHFGPIRIGLCVATAGSVTYGTGKPGQLGVPQLVAVAPPVLGTVAAVEIQSARPGTLPILLLGATQAALPYDDGVLLATPTFIVNVPVPIGAAGTLQLAGILPLDPLLCGASLYLQALIPDPAASGAQHLAMTPGLELQFGS